MTRTRVSSCLNSKVKSGQSEQTAWGTGAVTRADLVRGLFQPGFLVQDVQKYPER